jgi:hypothetical protein
MKKVEAIKGAANVIKSARDLICARKDDRCSWSSGATGLYDRED